MALDAKLDDTGILVLTPDGPLTAADFIAVAALADPWIETHGKLTGVLIDMHTFPGWEDFAALSSHLKFVREHHTEVRRIAALTDSKLLSLAPALARHFVAAEIKVFPSTQRDEALTWLGS